MSKPKRIYVCGKMSGIKDYNYPRFHQITKELRRSGYDVFNPAEIKNAPDWIWVDYMKACIGPLTECDMVYVLKGYRSSKGANIEIDLAKKLEIEIIYEDDYSIHQLLLKNK